MKNARLQFTVFTAVFAALAYFVFRGTWTAWACPVMPDAAMAFPETGYLRDVLRDWLADGRFSPFDLRKFAGSPYLWQELQYAVAAYLAALGMAYWLRGRGLSSAASFGSGLLLAFCGYWFSLFSAGHLGWFEWMAFGVFPFGLIDRAVRKNKAKNWLLLGACEAWACFRQADLWLLFAVFAAAYLIRCCVRERRLPSAKGLLLCAAAFAAVGAPGIYHAFGRDLAARDAQIGESKGTALAPDGGDDAHARWIFATNWSLPPEETLEFAVPRANGDTSCPMTLALGRRDGTGVRPYTGALGRAYGAKSGNYRQHSLYVGLLTCLLAIAAVAGAALRKGAFRGEIAFLAASAAVFWLFSLGRNCECVYRIVYSLPFGDYLRAPVKWHHLTEFCICALAGYGLEGVRRLIASRGEFAARCASFAAFALAVAGAADLARIDRLYCAKVDLSVVRSPNPAAEEIARRGGGRTADLVQGGNGLVAEAFKTRRIEMAADPEDAGTRFVWAGSAASEDVRVASWLKSRNATLAGVYAVGAKAIRRASPGGGANAILWELPGAPAAAPEPPKLPEPSLATLLGAISIAASAAVSSYAIAKSGKKAR